MLKKINHQKSLNNLVTKLLALVITTIRRISGMTYGKADQNNNYLVSVHKITSVRK